jgi:hypothetical protein
VSLFINEDDEHGATDIFPAVKSVYEPEGGREWGDGEKAD